MNRHFFYDKLEDVWMVRCEATGDRFSTAIWKNGAEQQQKCPCCLEFIK
jgi:hypothetical protein